jgi:hypothetical protein
MAPFAAAAGVVRKGGMCVTHYDVVVGVAVVLTLIYL